jgi:hypothetical protein
MKYDVEMGSSVVTYLSSFVKIGSSIQRLIGRDTQTTLRLHRHIFIFQNKERRLKKLKDGVYNK